MMYWGMNNISRPKLYQAIAEVLRHAHEFTTVAQIAERLGVSSLKVRNSITRARLWLAQDGVVLVNVLGKGYRLGSPDEFTKEADKASKRAFGHLSSMAKTIAVLRGSKFSGDVTSLQQTIINNLSGITVLFDAPQTGDFDTRDEWLDALGEWESDESNKLVPDEVRSDPETEVERV